MNLIQRMVAKKDEGGFTLVEMLVVNFIMAILAAIVVFAVNGVNDRGQGAACDTDEHTLIVAEEANFAANGSYTADQDDLVDNGFLHSPSTMHTVTLGGPAGYIVNPVAGGPCA